MSEETTIDPFAPAESGVKTKFGKLKLYANPINLKKGASYVVKGVHDREGNTKEWKGKEVNKSSDRFHVIMQVLATDKDGNEYEMIRDYLNNDKPYVKVVQPALAKVFGASANFPTQSFAFVKFEEVTTGESFEGRDGNPVEKTCWKVVAKFANEGEMKAAEKEYFARFQNGNGSSAATVTADASEDETLTKYKAAIVKNLTERKKSVDEVAKGFASVGVTLEQVQAIKDAIDDGLPV